MPTRVGAVATQDGMGLASHRSLEPTVAQGSMQAFTLPVEGVDPGDVVAVGQKFYTVESVVQTNDRFGFPLLVLRSLESGARAAIEFRNAATPVSVLRIRPMPGWTGEDVDGADVSGDWRPAVGIRLSEALE